MFAHAAGVRFCGLALSSYTVSGTATISGIMVNGQAPTPRTAIIPAYPQVLIVLVDDTWKAVTGITITTAGLRGISLWGLYYYA